jgi:hypothetical protein
MYSFAQRDDTIVVDEPLYGHFLRVTGADHPGRDEVLATVDTDGDAVMRKLLDGKISREILFMKQMAHHLVDVDDSFMERTENIFLIRDPREMLPSLTLQLPHARLEDTGLATQWHLFEHLKSAGQNPAILDSRELLLDPLQVLQNLCKHLDIEFCASMLTWEAGARPEDGIWAKHWYHALHRSTGFSAYSAKNHFPSELQPLLDECAPWYQKMFTYAIRSKAGD